MKNKIYREELRRLQLELIKLQRWIIHEKLRILVLFEGRDAAGKGGTIKRVTSVLNPRVCRVVALGKPTDRERSEWYFQRYVEHLPAAGELVLFDRSWYNRAGVESVMGFCSQEEVQSFLVACPAFEKMLVDSGIILIKYWFSVSAIEQEKRFQARVDDPTKVWKVSQMDLASRSKWAAYSVAKDLMFKYTDTQLCPWSVVPSDSKKLARLNCIHDLLQRVPYQSLPPAITELPPRSPDSYVDRPPMEEQHFVPQVYS